MLRLNHYRLYFSDKTNLQTNFAEKLITFDIMAKLGRPSTFDTPEEIKDLFEEYKTWAETNPIKVQDFVGKDGNEVYRKKQRPLSFDGFCTYVWKTHDVFIEQYFKREKGHYEAFVPICRAIKKEIRTEQIEGGMAGIYNPSITQRLNGLTEKVQTEVVEQKLLPDPEPEQGDE